MVFTTSFGNLIRAEGAVKDSMFCHLLSTIVNLVLDPLFILIFRMGVGGAAIATVLGNIAGAVYLLYYVFCRSDNLTLSPFPAFKHPTSILKILAIGLPNFISSTLVGLSHAFANQLLAGYGTIVLAGRAAAGKATTLVSTVQMGITIGVQPLLAYNYGAQNLSRIRAALQQTDIFDDCSRLFLGAGLLSIWENNRFLVSQRTGRVGYWAENGGASRFNGALFKHLLYCFQFSSSNWTSQIRISGFASSSRDFFCASFGHHGSFYGANGKYLGCYSL